MEISKITNQYVASESNTGKNSSPPKVEMQEPVKVIRGMEPEIFNAVQLQTEENKEKYQEILDAANEIIFGINTHFKFQIHEKTGTTIIKLIDNETQEVLREFPPEKVLNVVAGIWELAGILVDEKV